MRANTVVTVALGLVACFTTTVAAMLWFKRSASAPQAPVALTQPLPLAQERPLAIATAASTDVAALKEQLASKERIIERLQQELKQSQRQPPAQPERSEQRALRPDGQPGGRGFDMERLRTEDPERYAEIRARMKQFTEQANNAAQKRSQFIATLDPKLVKAEDQESLAKLQEGMKKMAELTAQMQEAQEKGTELDQETRREMWETVRELQPLMGVARSAALTDLALQLGYKQESAGEFVDYVNELVDQTSLTGGMGRGGPGGGNAPR